MIYYYSPVTSSSSIAVPRSPLYTPFHLLAESHLYFKVAFSVSLLSLSSSSFSSAFPFSSPLSTLPLPSLSTRPSPPSLYPRYVPPFFLPPITKRLPRPHIYEDPLRTVGFMGEERQNQSRRGATGSSIPRPLTLPGAIISKSLTVQGQINEVQ